MLKKVLQIALLLVSIASISGVAATDGPAPGCYPCSPTGSGN